MKVKNSLMNHSGKKPSSERTISGGERFSLSPAEGERAGVRGKCLEAIDQSRVPDYHSTPFHGPERLLSPSLSSIQNGGEGGRRPGEEAHRGSWVQSANFGSGNSHPGPLPLRGRAGEALRTAADLRVSSSLIPGICQYLSQRADEGIRAPFPCRCAFTHLAGDSRLN